MNNLLTRMTNEYDGEENEEFFSAKRIRLAALGICIVCFGAGLLFTDRLSLIKGLALGYIIAVLLFVPSKNDRTQGKSVMRRHRGKNDFDYDTTRSYNPDGYEDRPRYDEQGRPYDNRGYDNRAYGDNRNQNGGNGYPDNRNDEYRR